MRAKKVIEVTLVACGLSLASVPAHALSWDSVIAFVNTLRNEASAWAVNVKQTSVAAHQESQAEVTAKKQLSTAMGAISMSDRAMKSVTSFDPEVGQPVTIKCVAQQNGKLHVEADSQRQKDAARLMSTFASNRVGSRAAADAEVLSIHRDTYCTISEAKQGMCSLSSNGMQGWDMNYAGAFSEKTLAPEGELAAYAYAAMISDVRAEANSDCKSTACAAAQSQQLATAALSAMAANAIIGQATDRRAPMLTGL
jgi:hypothetical protein